MIQFRPSTLAPCVYLFILELEFVYSSTTKYPRVGPSVLQSHVDDEDFIIGSGYEWGSGSGEIDFDRFRGGDDEENEETATRKHQPILKVTTPDSSRISCVVCSGDEASCRDPYVRNAAHIKPCQSSVGGCLKVVTPSGDTYRDCLYGIFETAEEKAGCRVIKEDHVGHKFVNATICICHTNECNGYFGAAESRTSKTSAKTTASSDHSFNRSTSAHSRTSGQRIKTDSPKPSEVTNGSDLLSFRDSTVRSSSSPTSSSGISDSCMKLSGIAILLTGLTVLLCC